MERKSLTLLQRTQSFKHAPSNLKDRTNLFTTAGFIYTGPKDTVQCPQCHISIDNWKLSHSPLTRHRLLSPQCPTALATYKKRPKGLLHTILTKPRNKIYPQHYFQAKSRLAHYISTPTTVLADSLLDQQADEYWQQQIHNDLRNTYTILYKQILKGISKLQISSHNNINPTAPPYIWFVRTRQIKFPKKYDHLNHFQLTRRFLDHWYQLQPQQKQFFYNIAEIDDKRYRAAKIEQHFATNGIFIGYENNNSDNLIITPYIHDTDRPSVSTKLVQYIHSMLPPNF